MNGTYMTQEIIFEPFDSEECIAIEIAVGKLMGMDVYFNITLTRSDGLDDRIKLEPAEGVVVIAENESKFSITVV